MDIWSYDILVTNYGILNYTPLQFNLQAENEPLEREIHFGNLPIQFALRSLGSVGACTQLASSIEMVKPGWPRWSYGNKISESAW